MLLSQTLTIAFLQGVQPRLSVPFISVKKYSLHMQEFLFYPKVMYQIHCSACFNFPSRETETKSFLTLFYGCVQCINTTYLAPYWLVSPILLSQTMLQWITFYIYHLVCVCVWVSISWRRIGISEFQSKGYVCFKFDSFCQIALYRACTSLDSCQQSMSYFLLSSNTAYFQPFLISAKAYVKNSISTYISSTTRDV